MVKEKHSIATSRLTGRLVASSLPCGGGVLAQAAAPRLAPQPSLSKPEHFLNIFRILSGQFAGGRKSDPDGRLD